MSERRDVLRAFSADVARVLNENGLGDPDWRVEDVKNEEMRNSHINLVSGIGQTRAVLSVREGDRFVVRPGWPNVRNHYDRAVAATVILPTDELASPERVAAEIARRLMAGYQRSWRGREP